MTLKSNPFRAACVAISMVVLGGCTIVDDVDNMNREVELHLAELKETVSAEPEYQRVVLNKRFYVPPVVKEAINLPDWYTERVSFNSIAVPFHLVVDEARKNNTITVDYSDLTPDDLKTPISLKADNEEIGKVLRRIANQAGLAFNYVQERAVYSKFEVKRFPLAFLPGTLSGKVGRDSETAQQSSQSNSLSGLSSSMSTSGDKQYSGIKIEDISAVEEIKKAVKVVLSEKGTVEISDLGMTAIVRDRPYNVAEAAKVIQQFNDQAVKQVEIKASLIDVIFTEELRAALDYKLLVDGLGGKAKIDFGGGFTSGGAGTITPSSFTMELIGGDFDGSKILADVLKKQGAVSRTVFQRILTTNGNIGTSKAVTREKYIAEQYGNGATTGGIITSGGTKQETLETGQVLNVLPMIVNDDVVLKINSSLSSNLGITQKLNEETGTFVESPKVADMEFDQVVVIPSGQTLVVGGMKVDSIITDKSKAGHEAFGFARSGSSDRKETLLTISVRVTRGLSRGTRL